MVLKFFDAVQQFATGTGTGALVLGNTTSAKTRRLQDAGMVEGDSTYVRIQHAEIDAEWEIVKVTYDVETGQITRSFDDASSSYTGSLISFSAGNKIVSGVMPSLFVSGGTVADKTANFTITAAETNQTFTNAGAVGTVTATMPTPAVGLQYTFICAAAQSFVLDVGGSVQIAIGEIIGTAGGGASCNTPYSIVTLRAVSNTLWIATANLGSWTPS